MGELLRIGKIKVSGYLVRAAGQPNQDILDIGFSAMMSKLAPLQVVHDAGVDCFTYYAYSELFDDVLICEGQEPPEYIMTCTQAGDEISVKAERLNA